MNALEDLKSVMDDDEVIEAIVFGEYGWGDYNQPDPAPVPKEIQGKILTEKVAEQYMEGWSFYGGYGSPECYAVYVWTNKHVFWVTQYDGSTSLDSAPRNPIEGLPIMPGG